MTIDDLNPECRFSLRILATSDVHMNLSGWSETSNKPAPQSGLARLVEQVQVQRDSAAGAVVLLDNGDTFQGTPLARVAFRMPCDADHPAVLAMQAMGYDAMGLGNHDFDFGQEYLERLVAALPFPVMCANVDGVDGVLQRTILTVTGDASDGVPCTLRVGVTAALPQQTGVWCPHAQSLAARFQEPLAALSQQAETLRAEGADVVIVLAHAGLEPVAQPHGSEHFARAAADLPQVDAVVAGHSHRTFPEPGQTIAGTGDDTPIVQPGYGAAYLGVIDLELSRDRQSGWQVVRSSSALVTNHGNEPRADLTRLLAPARAVTQRHMSQHMGHTEVRLQSFFSTLQPCSAMDFTGKAMLLGLNNVELPADWRDLPRLAAIAPYMCGGLAGADHYINIPAGDVTRRAAEMLSPYEDYLTARKMRGQDLIEWLERAAAIYTHIDRAASDQFLLNPSMPSYSFDMIQGLSVEIDPTVPARYDAAGQLVRPDANRIVSVKWNGAPLRPNDLFVVAMSGYRANGGGGYPDVGEKMASNIDLPYLNLVVADAFATQPPNTLRPMDWQIVPDLQCSVLYDTSPLAAHLLEPIQKYAPEIVKVTRSGFLRLRLSL